MHEARALMPTPVDGRKIGILGGSFDPAHSGHLHVAEVALKRMQLDYVWWVPARGNPLKSTETPFEDRWATVLGQLGDHHPRMAITDIERRLDLNYTVDLIRILKQAAPRAHFVWLMGGDNLLGFHRWKGWNEIAKLVPIGVVARPGAGPRARLSKFALRYRQYRMPNYAAARLPLAAPPVWAHMRAPLNEESSTRLRLLKHGR